MPAVNGVGEPCAGEPHARFEAAGAGNGADLAKGTGVAHPSGKPAEDRPQALNVSEPPRQPPTLRLLAVGVALSVFLPTSWRAAGWRFFEPGGRPGPGLPGFGALAGQGVVARRRRNPRRTLAGVSRPGGAGCSQGRRRSAASGRASRSWA